MNVFLVRTDSDRYQYFQTARDDEYRRLMSDGDPLGASWSPPEVYAPYPRRQQGDFFSASSDVLIASPRAVGALRPFFEQAGEILPLPYKGVEYSFINVTVKADALDMDKTYPDKADRPLFHETRFVFRPDHFPASTLFKMPMLDGGASIYLWEGGRPADQEFRAVYERAGLQGLVFQELWSDGQ
ncbi:MAG: hypothetical protein ABI068_13470 [Ktedonobacterales bacterium]